jgi:hypothetical protein
MQASEQTVIAEVHPFSCAHGVTCTLNLHDLDETFGSSLPSPGVPGLGVVGNMVVLETPIDPFANIES